MSPSRPSKPFSLAAGRWTSREEFQIEFLRQAEGLPAARAALNLLADRREFLLGLAAAWHRRQTNLLLPSLNPSLIEQVQATYPDCYALADQARERDQLLSAGLPVHEIMIAGSSLDAAQLADARREPPADHQAVVLFTSGTTGTPKSLHKTWSTLSCGTSMITEYLCRDGDDLPVLIPTVPLTHMYGLEWAAMPALTGRATIYTGASFFPADIRLALEECAPNGVLVSTPTHLRALLASGLNFPECRKVVCATAPLDVALAKQVAQVLNTELLEIYGCSESGCVAYRYPIIDPRWEFFSAFQILNREPTVVTSDFLPAPVELSDVLQFSADGRFELIGRSVDLVKVAGKRASLTELNGQLMSIIGIEDGVFVDPSRYGFDNSGRLSALVVTQTLSSQQVRQRLADLIDPVFLPRPLKIVSGLPRSRTGKLPKADMQRVLAEIF